MDEQPTLIQRLFGRRRRQIRSSAPFPTSPPLDELALVERGPMAPSRTRGTVSFPQNVERAFRDWQVGEVIHQYEVQDILGKGGMGIVYKVYDSRAHTLMAVKRPLPQCFRSQRDKEIFIREVKTWINLVPHPHILRCFYVQELEGIPCPFAEYIDKGSLKKSIRERDLYECGEQRALERILDIAIQFAWGLHAAHEQGLVHQDVKPDNVLLTAEGIVKVSDFGLAKACALIASRSGSVQGRQATQESLPVSGGNIMTQAYCSPEQAALRKLTRKTDIWSWAVSVLEMFTGGVTWKYGPLTAAVLKQEQNEKPWAVHMPEAIRELLLRCLQQEPRLRPATMAEIAEKLVKIYAQLLGSSYARAQPTAVESEQEQALRLFERGGALALLGQLEKALAAYEQAIDLVPLFGPVYASKGNALFRLGRYEEALIACPQATRLAPTYPGAYFNTAQVLTALERREEALAALEQTIRLDSLYAPAYSDKGMMLSGLGKYEEALAACEQALCLDASDPFTHRNKSLILSKLGHYAEALSACEQAFKLAPNYAGAYLAKDETLFGQERHEEALAALEQALRIDPRYVNALACKGQVLAVQQKFKEALQNLEQAIHLNPEFVTAYYQKVLVLVKLGRYEEALTTYEQIIKLCPLEEAELHLLQAEARASLGRYEETLRLDPVHVAAQQFKKILLRDNQL